MNTDLISKIYNIKVEEMLVDGDIVKFRMEGCSTFNGVHKLVSVTARIKAWLVSLEKNNYQAYTGINIKTTFAQTIVFRNEIQYLEDKFEKETEFESLYEAAMYIEQEINTPAKERKSSKSIIVFNKNLNMFTYTFSEVKKYGYKYVIMSEEDFLNDNYELEPEGFGIIEVNNKSLFEKVVSNKSYLLHYKNQLKDILIDMESKIK